MGEILFLLSGTSRYLYKNDIYRTMALPKGYVLNYRYRDKWVDQELIDSDDADTVDGNSGGDVDDDDAVDGDYGNDVEDRDEDGARGLEGNDAVMTAVSASGWGTPEYYPLRKGVVEKVEIDREADEKIFYIYVKLCDVWPDYQQLHNQGPRPLADLDDAHWAKQDEGNDLYLFSKSSDLTFSESDGSWRDIVSTLTSHKEFDDSLFYRVGRIRNIDEDNNEYSGEKDDETGQKNDDEDSDVCGCEGFTQDSVDRFRRAYELSGDMNYVIEMLFDFGDAAPDNAESSHLSITCTEQVNLFPRDIRLGFKLDKRRVSLKTEMMSKRSIEYVSFSVEGDIEGANFEMPFILKGARDDDG